MRADAGHWVAWSKITGVGAARVRRLWEHFGDLASAWEAPGDALLRAGLDRRVVAATLAERPRLNPAGEYERLARAGVDLVTIADPTYPALLRRGEGAPACLHVRGTLVAEDEMAIAVVGSRAITSYGRQVTLQMVGELARQGLTIVSGLARGIDAVAHRAALDAGARTIAVLGCGVDVVYPSEHRALAAEIAAQGAVVSEFPLGAKPDAPNFPMRNRVIAGISLGTLVVEAGTTSGALITASYALDLNREVFAVPGSIYAPRCEGTNRLIARGEAKLVTSAAAIMEELNLGLVPQQLALDSLLAHDQTEASLLNHLGQEPLHVDALTRLVDLPISVVTSTLTMLELRGLVRQVSAMQFVRAR